MSAEIDEYPSLRFQDIRKKQHRRRTQRRMDGRENSIQPPQTKFAGGIIKMPLPFLIFSQLDYLIQIVDINSHKPTDLDLHCLQSQGYIQVQQD